MDLFEEKALFIIEEKMKCGQGINKKEFEIAKKILEKRNEMLGEEIKINLKRIEFLSFNVGGYDGADEL